MINMNNMFVVNETNADLEVVGFVYMGHNRDLAESVMLKRFQDSAFEKDFSLYYTRKNEILCLCFSANTLRLRGECHG